MPKAYSYIRFSTPNQSKGDSFRRQSEKAAEYAALHGLELADLKFRDLGISAFDGSNVRRGGLSDFLAAVKSGVVEPGSYLLIEALDRLSRAPPSQSQELLLQIINSGIVVVTLIDEHVFDKSTVDRNPFALIDAVIKLYAAHEESLKKADRFNKLYEARRKREAPIIGFTAPGWLRKKADKSGWEAIPEKADSIVRLFDMTLAGHGGVVTAKAANREGWEPVGGRGSSWHQGSISKILKNRAVIGEYQPKRLVEGKLEAVGLPMSNFFPAIIDEEVFNKVQAILAERSRIPRRRDLECRNILAGLLICGGCGATLALKRGSNQESYLNRYYACADRSRGVEKSQCCPTFHAGDLLAPDVELRRYRKQTHLPTRGLLAAVMRHIAEHVSREERITSIRNELNQLNANLSEAQKIQSNLIEVAAAGAASVAALAERLQKISSDIDAQKERQRELQLALLSASAIQNEEDIDAAIASAVRAVRDEKAIEDRGQLRDRLLQLVDHIWLWPGIAALRLKGESMVRWLPLHPDTLGLLLNPPALPPMRKHLARGH